MNKLRHISSVAYAYSNETLFKLIGYDCWKLQYIVAEEVTLAIRQSPEPYTPL